VRDKDTVSYQPVIAIFAVAALMALAARWAAAGALVLVRSAEGFIAFSITILAMLKLQDIESFSTMFLNYALLAKRWVP
jgi:hypothetical protein